MKIFDFSMCVVYLVTKYKSENGYGHFLFACSLKSEILLRSRTQLASPMMALVIIEANNFRAIYWGFCEVFARIGSKILTNS